MCFSVIFKITSINEDLAILAGKITNISTIFSNRMSTFVKIVIVFSSKLQSPVLIFSPSVRICMNPHPLSAAKGTSIVPTLG